MAALHAVKGDVDAKCLGAMLLELCDVRTDAAADIEHAPPFQGGITLDNTKPAVLPKAPDVTGMSQVDGGIVMHALIIAWSYIGGAGGISVCGGIVPVAGDV